MHKGMRENLEDKMPDITVSVGVFCECGEHLCKQSEGGNTPNRKLPFITVKPCRKCLGKSYIRGETAGKREGYEQGIDDIVKGAKSARNNS